MSRELRGLQHMPTTDEDDGFSAFRLPPQPLDPRTRRARAQSAVPAPRRSRRTQAPEAADSGADASEKEAGQSQEDSQFADEPVENTADLAEEPKSPEPEAVDQSQESSATISRRHASLDGSTPPGTSDTSPATNIEDDCPGQIPGASVNPTRSAQSVRPDTEGPTGTPLQAASAADSSAPLPIEEIDPTAPAAPFQSRADFWATIMNGNPGATNTPSEEESTPGTRTDTTANAGDTEEQIQNKMINEEYKIWKKNCVFLYDIIYSRALEWPTLTTQWLPDVKDIPGKPFRMHRMIIGSHTSNQSTDHLQIVHINIPNPPPAQLDDYNPRTEELGDYGASKEPMKLEVVQKIVHPGEVNKARYQPQNPNLIATWSPDHNVYVWDRTKHDSIPSSNIAKPNATLKGHKGEGFALEWNPFVEGQLLSGADDSVVHLWDLPRDFSLPSKELKPARTFSHHSATVNDLHYHPVYGQNLFGSVSDDQSLQIMDLRRADNIKPVIAFPNAHSDAINTLSFHPTMDKLVATAGADKTIAIFDLRFPKHGRIHTLAGHKDSITKISWHPTDSAILASAADDRRIIFWDISRAGMEQLEEDVPDGPPEMLFMHGGHTNRVSDFGWNANDEWVVVSAAEDNLIQVWRASRGLVEKMPPGVQRQEVGEA
ncbi:Histone acetyltransferase type B subunit 2 [Oleoguttula sp. CCFEE 5521]